MIYIFENLRGKSLTSSPRSFCEGATVRRRRIVSPVGSFLFEQEHVAIIKSSPYKDRRYPSTAFSLRSIHRRNNRRTMFTRSSNQQTSANANGAASRRAFRVSRQHFTHYCVRRPCACVVVWGPLGRADRRPTGSSSVL